EPHRPPVGRCAAGSQATGRLKSLRPEIERLPTDEKRRELSDGCSKIASGRWCTRDRSNRASHEDDDRAKRPSTIHAPPFTGSPTQQSPYPGRVSTKALRSLKCCVLDRCT